MENKDIEQQLIEASEKEYWTQDCNNPTALRQVDLQQKAFIKGAKSESSKIYHLLKIDVKDIKIKFEDFYTQNKLMNNLSWEKIFIFFNPYLKPTIHINYSWTSIEDRLPEDKQHVLVSGYGKRQFTAIFENGEFLCYNPFTEELEEAELVEYWMPQPPHPVK